jgi:abequosyltransferase
MKRIKLSICIATLNRGFCIGETLESIISQSTDEVQIVILDGGSTDNTTAIVEEYRTQFANLSYFRQDAPMGVDQDFTRSVELAKGEYCWLMSDDDILKPGAIRYVLNEIQKDYGLIVVNAEVRDAELSEVLQERILEFNSDHIYSESEFEQFFVDTAGFLSFIGCVVINRKLWNSREKEKYYGTLFVHIGVIFQQPIQDPVLVIIEPFIAIRAGNAQWSSQSFDIWFFKWPELIWSFPHYSNWAKAKIYPQKPYRNIMKLLSARASNSYSWEVYLNKVFPLLSSFRERILPVLVALLPVRCANLLGVIYSSHICKSALSLYYLKNSKYYYRRYLPLMK